MINYTELNWGLQTVVLNTRIPMRGFTAHKLNWTPVCKPRKLEFVNSARNSCIGVHFLQTNRVLTALVALQPVSMKYWYCRNIDLRDE